MIKIKRYLFPSLLGLVWLPIAQAATDCTTVTEIPQVECEALVALYNSTDGANWYDSPGNGWNVTNTPCSWWGITCSTGQVTGIDLSGAQLDENGQPFGRLNGTIPTSLGNLSQLEKLDLSTIAYPDDNGQFIEYGRLTGTIPSSLGNLSLLRELSLYGNQLTGSIPSELGNLSQLTRLDLGNSSTLQHGGNQLTGPIPSELGNLSQLEWLGLSNNQLTGSIPSELENLSQLWVLHLGNNQLNGEIPLSLSSLTNVSDLDLNYNNLTASDADLINFLNDHDPDWAETQFLAIATCATGNVTINPTILDFGSEAVDNSLALTANVRSHGCDDLQIDTVEFVGNDAAEFSVQNQECYDGEWQGETFTACQFNIVFSPTVAGDKEATFNIVFNDTDVQAATMPLQATAVDPEPPEISVSPNPIVFDTVMVDESATPQTVTVENTGNVNLQFDTITLTGMDAAEFSFYGECSSKTFMRPGEQCQLLAQLIPETEGDKQATLNFSSISTVPLIGQATPLLDCADGNITIQTVANGSWDSVDSWDLEKIPDENDVVRINSGHTITGTVYAKVRTLCIETNATLESLDDQGTALLIEATNYLGNKGTIRGQDGEFSMPGGSIYLSTGNSWWLGNPFYNEGSIIAGHGGDGEQQGGHGGTIHISGGGIINTPNENGNGGIIQAGTGGDITGSQAGQAGEGGRIIMWGSEFIRHQGDIRMTAGNGGNCNSSASGFQTGGEGGYIITNANLSIHLQGTFQAGNGSTNCNANGTAGVVYIDPAVISISGENTTISGGEVTINGADTIELTGLNDGAIRATTGDITLAAGEDNVIDMRGNTGKFLQAGGQVQILADEIVLDEEVKLSQVIQANNTMVGPSRVLRDVSLTVAGKLSGEPGESVFINVTLSNNGPETDTYTLSVTDSQGWALSPLPENSIEIEGLGGINFEQEVTLSANPGERNLITITATSQADPEVKATTEVQVTVAGGQVTVAGSNESEKRSGTKPLRTSMTVFVEIYGKGKGHVTSEPAGIQCEPTHCQAVDYAQDATGIECDPNYCSAVVDTATNVTLTATPDSGSVFKGWGGHKDCGDGELFMIGNKLCIAFFGQLED